MSICLQSSCIHFRHNLHYSTCCHNWLPPARGLETTQVFNFTILGVRSLTQISLGQHQGVSRAVVLSGACGVEWVSLPFLAPRSQRCSLARHSLSPSPKPALVHLLSVPVSCHHTSLRLSPSTTLCHFCHSYDYTGPTHLIQGLF